MTMSYFAECDALITVSVLHCVFSAKQVKAHARYADYFLSHYLIRRMRCMIVEDLAGLATSW